MIIGPLLALAFSALAAGVATGAKWPRLWLGATLAGSAAALVAAIGVLAGADFEWRSGFPLGGEPLHVRLDGVSALFLALLAVTGGAGAVYLREYGAGNHGRAARAPLMGWSGLMLGMALVLTASNGLHFLLGWEAFTVCAYFLIAGGGKPEARKAGWLYLAASHAGTVCLFAFFALLAARTGTWDLGPLRSREDLAPLFWLALAGFGVKAGIFPLHVWLPSAHASAPSHVSAILSGVAVKMGVYGIVRFSGWLPAPAAAGWVVIGLGAAGVLFGIAFALAQNDFKRLLAYCTVENVGVILTGLGAALLARSRGDASWGPLVLAGAMLHVWNHGAFKALLFFSAGSVLHATGTRDMSRLGGLWRSMPWTAGAFALGAAAVSGLPPLNGFVSEWMIQLGLFTATTGRDPSAWAAMPAAIALAVSGALALAAFVKAGAVIFLGAPRTRIAVEARECGWWMRAPMLAVAGVCVTIGLAPGLFWHAVTRAAGSWHPAWANDMTPSPLSALGVVHPGLALLLAAAGVMIWRKTRANGLRRGPTWDCGYAAPTARMQYGSGSFAGIVTGWFGWILRPERKLRRPRGPFPVSAIRLERFPETVLERVIAPVGRVVMKISSSVRRLQHGRLQSYILYVLAGVAALAAFVLLGGGS